MSTYGTDEFGAPDFSDPADDVAVDDTGDSGFQETEQL